MKFPEFYGTLKVHYCIHEIPQPVPILSQVIPIKALPSCLLKIHFNIIPPYMPRSSTWSLSLSFSHQDLVCTSPLHHMGCVPYPYCSSWFYRSNNVLSKNLHGTEHWMQLIVTQFSWNKRLITIFTKAPTCTCWMQSTPSYPILCNVALVSVSV